MAKAGRGSEQVMIRLPDGMRERIKSIAEQNGRSMNAEIVAVLEEAFPAPDQFQEELKFFDEIDEIQKKLERIKLSRQALELERGRAEVQEIDRMIKKADDINNED